MTDKTNNAGGVLAVLRAMRRHLNGGRDALSDVEWFATNEAANDAIEAVADLIEAIGEYVEADDEVQVSLYSMYEDAVRTKAAAREVLNAALARVGGA